MCKYCKWKQFFLQITRNHPKVEIGKSFLPSVQRVLKHNTDFGKLPHLRMFVHDYLCYVYSHRHSKEDLQDFIQRCIYLFCLFNLYIIIVCYHSSFFPIFYKIILHIKTTSNVVLLSIISKCSSAYSIRLLVL